MVRETGGTDQANCKVGAKSGGRTPAEGLPPRCPGEGKIYRAPRPSLPGLSPENNPTTAKCARRFTRQHGSGASRERNHAEAKSPGRLRVVVLGDSIAAGYRIERFEDTFPGILGTRLRGAGLPVEVLNFGVTGYNTEQEIETLRARALAFAPDIVLVAYCHNDREPPDPRLITALREAQEQRPVVPEDHGRRLLIRSALYRFLRYSAFPPQDAGPGRGATGRRDTVEASLRELSGLARERPFDVLFAVFPVLPHLNDPRYAKDHAELERLSAELGFTHLDLRSAFRECRSKGGQERLGLDLFHPSAAGHRCAGEAMALAVGRMIHRPGVPPPNAH